MYIINMLASLVVFSLAMAICIVVARRPSPLALAIDGKAWLYLQFTQYVVLYVYRYIDQSIHEPSTL